MKFKLILGLAMVAFALSTEARIVRPWSEAELENASDLVVVASPVETKDLDETNALGWTGSPSFQPKFRGVETTFKVSNVLKGMPANDKIVLHHYRTEPGWGSPPNGPYFVDFPLPGTNRYLLYLVKDGAGRYVPAAGQVDPYLSVRPPPTNSFGFPVLPPVADADPSIRHPVSVRVPTRLKIEWTAGLPSVAIDSHSLESTNLMVGTNMVTGVQRDVFVYGVGEPRPTNYVSRLLTSALDFEIDSRYWNTTSDGLSQPGKKYVVEMDFTAFETDVPPQHDWMPQGKNYKILWQRTLKQIVE